MKSVRFQFWSLVAPGTVFLVVFLILPLISIVVFSFWRTESYQLYPDWNLDNYRVLLTNPSYATFLIRSLVMATVVSAISLVVAWPAAFFITRYGGQFKIILLLLTSTPFLTGEILRVTAMQQILGPIGLINMALGNFGLQPITALMYSNEATAIGLVYLWLPFMVLAIHLSLLNFDFELLQVAKVNGARPLRAFREVTWPLNRAGSAIGVVLVFIPTLASSITSKFLGGPNGALFGNILAHQFGSTGTWALGSAMGVVLFLISMLVLFVVWKSIGDLRRSGISIEGGAP
ncbi:MAG TPA: ABC transporter permease [Rhodobacterales bacterium]|nr:ABC transporter permease [Rhodobacterales bacterium]